MSERGVPFSKNPRPFFCCLQLPPFFYFLTVFLQMDTHKVFDEARDIGSFISQSTDNEVRTFLCFPAQIDRLSLAQLCWNKERLLVCVKCLFSHLGTDASLNSCMLCMQYRLGWRGMLYGMFCFLLFLLLNSFHSLFPEFRDRLFT